MTRQREVFPYFNGKEDVYGDPMRIHRLMFKLLDGDVNRVIEQSESEDINVSDPAEELLLEAVRGAFDMVPFDSKTGEGATEADCHAALEAFAAFSDEKKTPQENSPTSPGPTGPPPSAPSTGETSSGSGCTSPG